MHPPKGGSISPSKVGADLCPHLVKGFTRGSQLLLSGSLAFGQQPRCAKAQPPDRLRVKRVRVVKAGGKGVSFVCPLGSARRRRQRRDRVLRIAKCFAVLDDALAAAAGRRGGLREGRGKRSGHSQLKRQKSTESEAAHVGQLVDCKDPRWRRKSRVGLWVCRQSFKQAIGEQMYPLHTLDIGESLHRP